jgi:hypothetical protein
LLLITQFSSFLENLSCLLCEETELVLIIVAAVPSNERYS